MTSIIETGNHIAQVGNGAARRKCARLFVSQIKAAIDGETPWAPVKFLENEKVSTWIDEYPNYATSGIGLGDLSIIKDWEEQKKIHKSQRVYIWSLDKDLAGYEYSPN